MKANRSARIGSIVWVLGVIIALGASSPLLAQGTGRIIGTVSDADTNEGDSYNNPIGAYFQSNPRIQFITPLANLDLTANGYDNDDTAFFFYRVDYALPSTGLNVRDSGIERVAGAYVPNDGPSDHWPVWVDLDFVVE